jgi:hypothetical protein
MIIDQLFDIYKQESWHKTRMNYEDFTNYTEILIDRKNTFWVEIDGQVVGYMELLKINFEQLGRLVCDEPFYVDLEDTTSGNIAWVQSFWIDARFRNGEVIRKMKEPYYERISTCDYITGKNNKHEIVKVYKTHRLVKLGA